MAAWSEGEFAEEDPWVDAAVSAGAEEDGEAAVAAEAAEEDAVVEPYAGSVPLREPVLGRALAALAAGTALELIVAAAVEAFEAALA